MLSVVQENSGTLIRLLKMEKQVILADWSGRSEGVTETMWGIRY